MSNKAKTYRKPVFAGKDIPVIGMDQGKGKMYQGLGTWYCFNFFYDSALLSRSGQVIGTTYSGSILNGGRTQASRFLHEDTNVWIEGIN